MSQLAITVKSKAVRDYYETLRGLDAQGVRHELGLRRAFEALLVACAREVGWTYIAEQTLPNGKRPDGVLQDAFHIRRGYWEAKDTADDLAVEVRKKIDAKYPTLNTIFEDTRRALLYQGDRLAFEADLTQPGQLVNLLTLFFGYSEPQIESFERAVAAFKDRIPELAEGLLKRIQAEHLANNQAFNLAFESFLALCRTSLDPQMTRATVDEMLVQHLLTERLFRTVFGNDQFTNRNVIAAEIEKVIQALTSRAFDRRAFLQSLDVFYQSIEGAAQGVTDWSEKQAFLNTVYERFFQGFSIRQADTHGIVYTPQEIVDFMCASVEEVLQREFGRSLAEPGVQILDPATGTGNFVVNLLRRIPTRDLQYKYQHDLFANEIMLLPYYIASLNIEHAYYERTGTYEPFEGIAFADTLEMEGAQMQLFSERNTERIQRERDAHLMVIIGNPPYNVGQQNENDNNKNRRYKQVDDRIRATYAKDSQATNKNALSDAYVKFFRWATDRLQGRDGVVCYVSNNSFVDQIAFDGMRKHLLQDFTQVYHLDLHGNIRHNPKLSGTTHNVFGIQVGVGITVAIRASANPNRALYYFRVPEDWRREEKTAFLEQRQSLAGIDWQELHPNARNVWLTDELRPEFDEFLPMGTKEGKASQVQAGVLFGNYGRGVATSRDTWVYDFHREQLIANCQRFIAGYNSEVDRWRRRGDDPITIDDFVTNDDTRFKWSESLKNHLRHGDYGSFSTENVRQAVYRPFCKSWMYFDRLLNERVYQFPQIFPTPATESENVVICVSSIGQRAPFMAFATNVIPNLTLNSMDANLCFPYYTYAEDGTNRRENITDWALAQFQAAYGADVTKRDIFHYVYGLLHHPTYRERYAENLKRELPRIPLLGDAAQFRLCARVGADLAALHLGYETAPEYRLDWRETPGPDGRVSFAVRKMRLTPDKTALTVNETLTLTGIPAACFAYRLGNRSALDWVIDQYQVTTDARSGIVSDPNRADDPQYIVRLVGRVITVSVETQRLVGELAALTLA
ncbi:MAG TPA: type ISP restriction/modification enzyme [Ktedonobacterales bacterium]|nr:type ISP restriction/modification enzyme [Ktedonobacterales bacterium]